MKIKHVVLIATAMGLAFAAARAADLPKSISARGTLIAAIVPNYPPMELRDPATNRLTGFDVELGEAMAKKLGLKMEWQETSFAQMLNSVKTGRVDIILSGMSDLASRHETADFVDYLQSGAQFFTQATRAKEFPTRESLCGRSVGASRRTSLPGHIKDFSDAFCVGKGRPAINVVGTEGSADARTQLRQSRIDAAMQGGETLPYIMSQDPGVYALIGEPVFYSPMGIAVAKDNPKLRDALVGALKAVMADGTYAKLLKTWSLEASGLKEVTVNAGH